MLILLLACGGEAPPTEAPPSPAPPAEKADPATPKAKLPAGPFKEAGWLGLAGGHAKSWWLPKLPPGGIAVFDAEALKALPEGARFPAIGNNGPTTVQFRGIDTIPWGCDEGSQEVAVFASEPLAAPGPVWIGGIEGLVSVPILPAAGPSWTAGATKLTLVPESDTEGKLLFKAGENTRSFPFEKHYMEGADKDPLDLNNDSEIGPLFPGLLLRGEEGYRFVLRQHSYEGMSWQVIQTWGEASLGSQYLYWCAF